MQSKVLIFLINLGVILTLLIPCCAKAEESADFNNLQFSVDNGKIYFFDPATGRIFIYQITTNRLTTLLTLKRLGEDLEQARSLRVIQEGENSK